MTPSLPRNGPYPKWAQLWVVLAGVLAIGSGALALHASRPHAGVVERHEQEQFEKRVIERLQRLEATQAIQGADIKEILRRLK